MMRVWIAAVDLDEVGLTSDYSTCRSCLTVKQDIDLLLLLKTFPSLHSLADFPTVPKSTLAYSVSPQCYIGLHCRTHCSPS